MEGVPAIYLGRVVSKDNFRAFIYSVDGSQKLVESWGDFEKHMQSGIWFATFEETELNFTSKDEKVKKGKKRVIDDDYFSEISKEHE